MERKKLLADVEARAKEKCPLSNEEASRFSSILI